MSHSANGWIASFDPAAQRQLLKGYWNDIRVRFGNGRITVRINGWKALDVAASLQNKAQRIAFTASHDSSDVMWRNVRMREFK